MQMYVSGCSGNVTAGKYNNGSPANRPVLADRIYRAMVESESVSRRHSLKALDFRNGLLRLERRKGISKGSFFHGKTNDKITIFNPMRIAL